MAGEEHRLKDPAQRQAAEQGKGVFCRRAQPGDRDHIPRRFRGAAAVQQQRGGGQGQRGQAVPHQVPEIIRVKLLKLLGKAGVHRGDIGHVFSRRHGHQPDEGGKKGEAGAQTGHAVIQQTGQAAPQGLAGRRGKIQQAVQHQHGGQAAGEHGRQGTDGEKQQALQTDRRQPVQNGHRIGAARRKLAEIGDGRQQHVGHCHKAQARGKMGDKQRPPGHRQGVEQAGAAALEQIAPHGGGGQAAEDQGHDQGRVAAGGDDLPVDGAQHVGAAAAALRQTVQQRNGQKHQPDGQIAAPDGPEAGDILADQRAGQLTAPGL